MFQQAAPLVTVSQAQAPLLVPPPPPIEQPQANAAQVTAVVEDTATQESDFGPPAHPGIPTSQYDPRFAPDSQPYLKKVTELSPESADSTHEPLD